MHIYIYTHTIYIYIQVYIYSRDKNKLWTESMEYFELQKRSFLSYNVPVVDVVGVCKE